MCPEPKKWVKLYRLGNTKGVAIQLDKETWEDTLLAKGIPLDTPLDKIRVTRYATKDSIILRIKLLKDGEKDY